MIEISPFLQMLYIIGNFGGIVAMIWFLIDVVAPEIERDYDSWKEKRMAKHK